MVFDINSGRRGIVAVTGELTTGLLIQAYMQGVFPWYNEADGEPVVWWCPDPRFVVLPQHLHIPERLDRFLRHSPFTYTIDRDFSAVINGCASVNRRGQQGTWIGPQMIAAYTTLHAAGYAHSVEVWDGSMLAGGFYGVLIGSVFCGESMFSLQSDSAKSAFALFARSFFACGGQLIDSQVYTDNLARFGAFNVSRDAFLRLEGQALNTPLFKPFSTLF
jgi:leucyl/phenylalanyl-tRNA---protein transferase